MKVRSITLFAPIIPQHHTDLTPISDLARAGREALEAAGYEVQTVRLATPPWPLFFSDLATAIEGAQWLDEAAPAAGVDYVSLGPVDAVREREYESMDVLIDGTTELLRATRAIFCSCLVASASAGMNVRAIERCGHVIARNATIEPDGFGNLRFAVLANVAPGSPFFPAAYADPAHAGAPDAPITLALALESADLAVSAYRSASTLDEAMARLVTGLEESAQGLVSVLEPFTAQHNVEFAGLDFSLAPFPDEATSSAGAIESLGAAPFGAMGTLAVAALTTQALQHASYPRCGFSGLMLPILEDATLAARSGIGSYDLHSLLLFSAVCGTGLDTVPLPGDSTANTLAALLLDVAALALRLDKPLTARLMPIPGKAAGEVTTFDFPYFANATILAPTVPQGGVLLAGEALGLRAT